jgi:integrase
LDNDIMPKRVPALSAKQLAATKAAGKPTELIDGLVPGLRVRVMPTGRRTWSLSIRDSKGVRRRFAVGEGLGLAEARVKARELHEAVRQGQDPTAQRRAARRRAAEARSGTGTLRALVTTYFDHGPGKDQRRAHRSKRLVLTVFDKLLDGAALDLERSEIQRAADDWRSPSSASLAVRLLRPCLKWAVKRGFVRSGVAEIDQPGKVGKRERFLTRDELKLIWPKLKGPHGDVVRWLLWTGCRLNEAVGMTWAEIDGDIWKIPAARAKSGQERAIPLPRQAVDLLRTREPGAPGSLVFLSARGGVLTSWDRETKKLHAATGTSGWHRHDLRRTVATMLGDLGVAPHVVSVVLGHMHIAEGATAVYARSRYQPEHAEALQALADHIDRTVIS